MDFLPRIVDRTPVETDQNSAAVLDVGVAHFQLPFSDCSTARRSDTNSPRMTERYPVGNAGTSALSITSATVSAPIWFCRANASCRGRAAPRTPYQAQKSASERRRRSSEEGVVSTMGRLMVTRRSSTYPALPPSQSRTIRFCIPISGSNCRSGRARWQMRSKSGRTSAR